MTIRKLWNIQVVRYLTHYEFIQPQLPYLGLLGVLAFPSAYLIFTEILHTSYENIYLRVLATLSFIPLLFSQKITCRHQYFFPLYLLFCLFIWVGIYFSFMLNMNEVSTVWASSIMFGVVIIFVFMDWISAVLSLLFSHFIGYIIFAFENGSFLIHQDVAGVYVVLLFTLSSWAVLSSRSDKILEHKRRNMLAIGGKVVHDLQTPLSTVQLSVNTISRQLVDITTAYSQQVPIEDQSHDILKNTTDIESALLKIKTDLKKLSLMSRMLLKTLKTDHIDTRNFKALSMHNEWDIFFNTYPLHSNENNILTLNISHDFNIIGHSELFQTVLYNIINNAFFAISSNQNPSIQITTEQTNNKNILIIEDNGVGIPEAILPNIFDEFYSTKDLGKGTGLGLFAARNIIASFKGNIECSSIHFSDNSSDQGTKFILSFS